MRGRAQVLASAALVIASGAIVSLVRIPFAGAQERGSDVGGQPARRRVTKYPKLVQFVAADYPPEKKASGIQGSVVLTIEIAETGHVTSVTVAQSAAPDFDAAAAAAAKQFVFEPAEVDGKAAPAKITYRYDFTMTAESSSENEPSTGAPPSKSPTAPSASPSVSPAAPASSVSPQQTAAPPPTPPSSSPTPSPIEQVEVRARARERRETNQTTVRAEEARKVAGTQGDVLKVVQNLPGVSRPPIASGQIVVWGSAPKDTRVYVDGVEIPALYHGSGLRGTINSDLVSSIDLVPGAFGPDYGRSIGGLVRVETKDLPRGTHGYVGVDTLDGSAFVSTELSRHARIAVTARQSWLDRVLSWTSAPDVGDYFPIPRYRDAQLKATLDLRKRESLDVVILGSTDELTRTVPSADPAKTRTEDTSVRFWRAYARYTNTSDDGDTTTVTPFVGQDSRPLLQRFGAAPTSLDVDANQWGVRTSFRSRVASALAINGGVDALGTSSKLHRRGSLTLPAREGDIAVFGQPPSDEYAADDWNTNIVDVAPFLYADIRLGPIIVTPGARFDAYLLEGSRKTPRVGTTPEIGFSRLETAFAPRLSARWTVSPRLALTAAYGTYHQAPEPEDLSPVFGTPDLALSRATHATFGEALRITESLTAELVAFRKTMKDLVVRSRLPNPLLARALTQNGEGQSFGVQFLLRQELWKGFFGWVSYSISKSERRYEGDDTWRPFDFDQPHVLSIVASQEIGRWGFGARFRYASGNPRTPVIGSYYDARNDRYDPVFGAQNTIRIPAFWQIDVRVERTFAIGPAMRINVFADVQNITNRDNAEEIVYSASFRDRGVITGLPIIAVVGGRFEF